MFCKGSEHLGGTSTRLLRIDMSGGENTKDFFTLAKIMPCLSILLILIEILKHCWGLVFDNMERHFKMEAAKRLDIIS